MWVGEFTMVKASSCSLESLLKFAEESYELSQILSYVQVEYGLDELRSCWEGFIVSSDDYYVEFETESEVYCIFGRDLGEYVEFVEKQLPY